MLKHNKIDEFFNEFMRLLPDDVHRARADLERNLKAAMHATFARMDLVTREEYDVQTALLSRTRALLDDLETRVAQLEEELNRQGSE